MKILLVSVGAKFSHKTLAAHCLKAYCDEHSPFCETEILECSINEQVSDIAGIVYEKSPVLIGLSVYIWNVDFVRRLIITLKKILRESIIVLGGPEVSYEKDLSAYPQADYIIRGAGELAFSKLLNSVTKNEYPPKGIVEGISASFENLPTPFNDSYFDSFGIEKYGKIEDKLIYYESSRGCPFNCSYCLSSNLCRVEYLPVARVKEELSLLMEKGARIIKFVDRTFNLKTKRVNEILCFIAEADTDRTFHFEAAADLFESSTMEILKKMPAGRVQFEVGIQSTNIKSLEAVNRNTDLNRAFENIKILRAMGNCHLHLDLIAGLPHETPESFASAVSLCLAARPHMLQVGFLKLLKGTEVLKAYPKDEVLFTPYPPYEILQSDSMSYADLRQIKKLDRVIDKFYNSGMFENTVSYALTQVFKEGYDFFMKMGEALQGTGDIKSSLKRSYSLLYEFLLPYADKSLLSHYIKLDCLSFDPKGNLPDQVEAKRDIKSESDLKRSAEYKGKKIRVEDFELTGEKILFVYEERLPVSGAFPSYTIGLIKPDLLEVD